jgi:hypothetical protein
MINDRLKVHLAFCPATSIAKNPKEPLPHFGLKKILPSACGLKKSNSINSATIGAKQNKSYKN